MTLENSTIYWLQKDHDFPLVSSAWGINSPAPGLLAAGGSLNPESLKIAYRSGIFPWFSEDQPPLWWSPDPRMILKITDFKLHNSFKKILRSFIQSPNCQVRIDTNFHSVIKACAESNRKEQEGTWINSKMLKVYQELHHMGQAHSIETWRDGELVGGLYLVAIGRAVFGESMFSKEPNASKIALAALVAFCRHHRISQIDCQQNTAHLLSLGAREVRRDLFIASIREEIKLTEPKWYFEQKFWDELPLFKVN